ncbi:MAG TPA: DUF4350 domain-containing protein [Gemmatimonadales bacterium]|nr:DUF4350 domain-containing protein [Gemmatimonadales bacterium]
MRRPAELALGAALLVALGIGAAVLGSRRARVADADERRTTYLAAPGGARGFADALDRLGVSVVRHRRSIDWLDSLPDAAKVVVVLQPSVPLTPAEGKRLAGLRADLLVAGDAADPVMTCLGYRVRPRAEPADVSGVVGDGGFPRVEAELVRHLARTVTDSSARADGRDVTCEVPTPARVDTLLLAEGGRAVVLALGYADGRRVTLVADDVLFSNRALRETAAGPFALGLVVPRYRRVVIDELHHGYRVSGSLAGAAIDWSLGSPWGWAAWQLAAVGVLALLAAGVRFGPVRRAVVRRRRSPLEHVRALATALAAARGHDTAARLLVRGLRRRLSRSGRPVRGDADAWLEGLEPSLRTDRGRATLAELTALTRRRAGTEDVLRAAHAVETLWEELKPS